MLPPPGEPDACIAISTGPYECSLRACADSFVCDDQTPTYYCSVEYLPSVDFLRWVDPAVTADGSPCLVDQQSSRLVAPYTSAPQPYLLASGPAAYGCNFVCGELNGGRTCSATYTNVLRQQGATVLGYLASQPPPAYSPANLTCRDILGCNDSPVLSTYFSGPCRLNSGTNQCIYSATEVYEYQPAICSAYVDNSDEFACACVPSFRRRASAGFFRTLAADATNAARVPPGARPSAAHLEAIAEHAVEDIRSAGPMFRGAECEIVRGPSERAGKQVCCAFSKGGKEGALRCLPSIVVAGAQKAGSSFVHAALMNHPEVRYSALEKEIHFFDSRLVGGLHAYFEKMPVVSRANASRTVTIDSSPSYILKEHVCSSIHAAMPDAVVVVVLRNPVHRAWSEHNMLVRQNEDRKDFRGTLEQHLTELVSCVNHLLESDKPTLIKNAKVNKLKNVRQSLDKCAPEPLTKHSRWTLFKGGLVHYQAENRWDMCLTGGKVDSTSKHCRALFGIDTQEADIDSNSFSRSIRKEADKLADCMVSDHSKCFIGAGSASDLTRHQLFRGAYFLQLENCIKSIPEEKLVVLESESLRHCPAENLNKILRAAGLAELDEEAKFDTEAAWKTFHETYPDFDKTGWRANGEYEGMDQETETFLKDFFAPLNEELFELIGERFEHWQ